jgi:hypothetical protein
MKNYKSAFLSVVLSALSMGAFAQTPLMSHIYAADPSAKVWESDPETLWLYTSHDIPGTNHHATMHGYHVFSTKDLVNWIDHGRVLSVDDVDWAFSHAWAIDAVYRNGKYYLVYCMKEGETGMFRTGLATSDLPQGPFTDIGFINDVEWGQDPCLFIDEDNTPYLYWGAGGSCHAVQLTDDLLNVVPGSRRNLSKELFEVFEGPWVHKYAGKYYLSYPALPDGNWPQAMYYAISDKPLGPYKYVGEYIARFDTQSGTNHGSIVKFKDDWIAFYHSAIVSGGMSEVRNLMADFLYYDKKGRIKTITPSNESIFRGQKPTFKILLEAESADKAGGKMEGVVISNKTTGFSGAGYVSGFDVTHDYVQVLAQVAKDTTADLIVRLSCDEDSKLDILVGVNMLDGWNGTQLSKTDGWQEINFGKVNLAEGNNLIRISSKNKNSNLKIDYILLDL